MRPDNHPLRPRAARPKKAAQRGQAMLEYSIINWLLIEGLVLATTVRMVPTPTGNKNVIETFLEAYQIYYDSFYFVLNLPFP